jgi:putative transposase
MAAEALPVEVACRVLDVSVSGNYAWRSHPPSQRAIRHVWLSDVIREVHLASRGIYGSRRIHAELVLGRQIAVSHGQVELLMRRAAIRGVGERPKWRRTTRHHRQRSGEPPVRPSGAEPPTGTTQATCLRVWSVSVWSVR